MATDKDFERIYRRILGESPGSPAERLGVRDEREQRILIARSLKLLTEHTAPEVLITGLVAALAFLCDEHNFNRAVVADELGKFQLSQMLEVDRAVVKGS